MSSQITFQRVSTDEARIYDADGDHVGDLFRHPDILNAGRHVFILHLDEDPRGPVTVNERGCQSAFNIDPQLEWAPGVGQVA